MLKDLLDLICDLENVLELFYYIKSGKLDELKARLLQLESKVDKMESYLKEGGNE